MKRLSALAALLGSATIALAQELKGGPVAAPAMSEWGLIGLGVVVAVAAGISLKLRNRK